MQRTSLALRIIVPAVMIGLILGISFIEAPLKFQAPGITIPLGLGIGRLVFAAANIVAVVGLIVVTVASIRPRLPRGPMLVLGGLWVLLLIEILVVRPPLNARTDALLAGQDPGESPWHYVYIACDVVILVLLVVFVVMAVRAVLPARAAPAER